MVVYSTPDRNEFFSVPIWIIRSRAGLASPDPGLPGPFSLGGPGMLEAALTHDGFRDVTVSAIPAPLKLPTAAVCVRFERGSFGALHQMLATLPEQDREPIWKDRGRSAAIPDSRRLCRPL